MKNETIEYSGKVYEKGKLYFFYDDDKKLGGVYKLTDICRFYDELPFNSLDAKGETGCFIRCVEVKDNLGTITDAPVELVDGAAYMFNTRPRKTLTGLYIKVGDRFVLNNGTISKEYCTNIREMVVVD